MSDIAETDTIHDFIAKAIADHPVVLFMKGVPDSPQCGFSAICVQILDHLGVDFVGVNVLQSNDLRQGIKSFSDWPTIPNSTSRASSSAVRTSCARCSRPAN